MSEYSNGTYKLDQDFEFEGREFWIKGEVVWTSVYEPAIFWGDNSCPEERSFEGEVVLTEVCEYTYDEDCGQREREMDERNLDVDLEDAIKDYALSLAEGEL